MNRRESKTSNRDKASVFDPDPTDAQLRMLERLSPQGLKPSDLANPEVAQLIIENQKVNLIQLKNCQNDIALLRAENDKLRDDREALRIGIAKLESSFNTSWFEIPISIISGFAINILTTDINDGLGRILLIISIIILLALRGSQIINSINRLRRGK